MSAEPVKIPRGHVERMAMAVENLIAVTAEHGRVGEWAQWVADDLRKIADGTWEVES